MAKTINELDVASALTGDEEVPVWQNGTTIKVALGDMLGYFGLLFGIDAGLTASGTTQSTGLQLAAAVNVFTTVLPGGCAVLPSTSKSGTVVVVNDTGNDLIMFPPEGAQISSFGVNSPVMVSAHGSATFTTKAPTSQWYVA